MRQCRGEVGRRELQIETSLQYAISNFGEKYSSIHFLTNRRNINIIISQVNNFLVHGNNKA